MLTRPDTADSGTYAPIQDYAIIGDCGSAALVSRTGAIDWLCWPRFDSASVFGALLDVHKGGAFRVGPVQPARVVRRYLDRTNVLETTFTTDTGVLRLTDCMPLGADAEAGAELQPEHEVLRVVEVVEGAVDVAVAYAPRFDYGRTAPRLQHRGALGYTCTYRNLALTLRSDLPLALAPDAAALHGRKTLRPGRPYYLALAMEQGAPAVLPLLGEDAAARLEGTVRYWRAWAETCRYAGPHHDAVLRSILALKLLTYAPAGSIIAAPTTSLPEHIGGERNWDYRYCWLRDASFTLRAFFELGFAAEGEAFLDWLLHTTSWTSPHLHVLYDVHGGTHVDERTLDHLEGYRGSRPVRIGNGAQQQFQLDLYGEVVEAAFEFVHQGGTLGRIQRRLLVDLGKTACQRWQEADNGIWEVRGERRPHTYSKVMCWVALDRLLKLHDAGHLRVPYERFAEVRDAVRDAVEARGYDDALGAYASTFGGDQMDASLLLLALYGYADPRAERMAATYRCVEERLGQDGLLYRYRSDTDDGMPSGEGAFGICSFWAVEYLARAGQVEAAADRLTRVLSYANDVGLFAEEIDPASGALLGNFPQAFTHVGLINAALVLAEAQGAWSPQRAAGRAERGDRVRPEERPVAR